METTAKPRKSLLKLGLKWLGGLILIGALAFAGAVYWYFYNIGSATGPEFALDISTIRTAADDVEGEKPTHIDVEIISHTPVPKIAMLTGTDWSELVLVRAAYRIVSPTRTLILDTGHDEENARAFGASEYSQDAWARSQQAIGRADQVIITHGHEDHAGGLGASTGNAWLSDVQIKELAELNVPVPAAHKTITFNQNGLSAIAPGVVVIKAPGHTPGSQMVYVQQADGTEFMFMGDTASLLGNVLLQRPRSRYVTDRLLNSDRNAVLHETTALERLINETPDLILVPGHDGDAINALIKAGHLSEGF